MSRKTQNAKRRTQNELHLFGGKHVASERRHFHPDQDEIMQTLHAHRREEEYVRI